MTGPRDSACAHGDAEKAAPFIRFSLNELRPLTLCARAEKVPLLLGDMEKQRLLVVEILGRNVVLRHFFGRYFRFVRVRSIFDSVNDTGLESLPLLGQLFDALGSPPIPPSTIPARRPTARPARCPDLFSWAALPVIRTVGSGRLLSGSFPAGGLSARFSLDAAFSGARHSWRRRFWKRGFFRRSLHRHLLQLGRRFPVRRFFTLRLAAFAELRGVFLLFF